LGETPLHVAIRAERMENVQTIIRHIGETLNDSDRASFTNWPTVYSSRTALHYAAHYGRSNCLHLLHSCGASVEGRTAESDSSLTPLMIAASRGHFDCCEWLVNAGYSIQAVDTSNRSALMHSVINGHSDVLRLLIDKRARTTEIDTLGNTAADYARQLRWSECEALLTPQLP
ncbi:hypothetical protein PFISCL1PPCAC_12651, partial [Pristionchus fissidentatus]